MRSIKSASRFKNDVNQEGYRETRSTHSQNPITTIFKKHKALSNITGEQLAGDELRPVFALPLENKRQAHVLAHERLLDQMISSAFESSPGAGPIPIMKRWALQPVRRCMNGM